MGTATPKAKQKHFKLVIFVSHVSLVFAYYFCSFSENICPLFHLEKNKKSFLFGKNPPFSRSVLSANTLKQKLGSCS
jgi:hypothetical protein